MTYEEMVDLLRGKIDLSEKTIERFKKYASLLKEWNEKMNLTAITEPKDVAIKHFADSLSVLNYVDIPNGASITMRRARKSTGR